MARVNTQDNQKVVHSSVEKFKSFVGSVQNVSSTKNMSQIYDNMTKLFDVFTRGVLAGQGANSEILLRNVCDQLNDDFLKIVQDSDAVDKIIEQIKNKQNSLTPDTVDDAMVSQTTKKVVKKTLDPNNLDPMSVVLDFTDELQTAILQVKLNLSRDYEKRKLLHAKSEQGQKEDIDRLNEELHQQTQAMVDSLQEMHKENLKWMDDTDKKSQGLLQTFGIVGESEIGKKLNGLVTQLEKDKDISSLVNKNDNLKNLVKKIQGYKQPPKNSKVSVGMEGVSGPNGGNAAPGAPKFQDNQQQAPDGGFDVLQKEFGFEGLSDDSTKLMKNFGKSGAIGKFVKEQNGTKLKTSPQNGMCVCPTCGNQHQHGPSSDAQPQMGQGAAPLPTMKPADSGGKDGSGINQSGVSNALGKIHQNIGKLIKNGAFKGNFTVDYNKIQMKVNGDLRSTEKEEGKISQDLDKTQTGIKKLKGGRGFLSTMIFGGPLGALMFTVVGGLILITLARIAWRKWKKAYMPQTDKKKFTIFGIPIPGVNEIKAFAIGIYNFVRVGIPNKLARLKHFFTGVYSTLFGKNGCLRNVEMIKITAKKLIGAWIIGHTKKVGGAIMKIIGKLISFIPGFGPLAQFIIEFAPEIYTFITTQLMLYWQNKNAETVAEGEAAAAKARRAASQTFSRLRKQVIRLGRKIKPFAPPESIPNLMTPNYTPGDIMRNRPKRAAIYRRPTKAKFDKASTSGDVRSQVRRTQVKSAQQYYDQNLQGAKKWKSEDTSMQNWTQLLAKINHDIFGCWVASVKGIQEEGGDWDVGNSNYRAAVHNVIECNLEPYVDARIAEMQKYIGVLKGIQERRFGSVKGPLYDPANNGWNIGYRVRASDLMSAIPTNPFESIHSTMDIPFGIPYSKEETKTIGYLPFKWMHRLINGGYSDAPIVANPILYEMARAEGRIQWLLDIYNHLHNRSRSIPTKMNDGVWHNLITSDENLMVERAAHQAIYGWEKRHNETVDSPDTIIRAFSIDWARNYENPSGSELMTFALSKGIKYNYSDKFDQMAARWALGAEQASPESVTLDKIMNLSGPNLIDAMEKRSVYQVGFSNSDLSEERRGVHDYDKLAEENGREEWKAKLKSNWELFSKKYDKYGVVRTLMLDWGISHLFDSRIMSPPSQAAHIVEGMTSFQLWRKWDIRQDVMDRVGYMAPIIGEILMYKYKVDDGVFETALKDQGVVNTFARSFLEYFGYIVLPQWKLVDKMIIDFTNGKGEEESIGKQISKLTEMFNWRTIVDWLFTHIRFKNAQMRIVDYSNATDEQKTQLDKLREQLNIPSAAQKAEILKYWESNWNKFGEMEPDKLKAEIDKIEGQIKAAAYEARYIGDHSYEEDLHRYYQKMYQAYKSKTGSPGDTKLTNNIGVAYMTDKFEDTGKSPEQIKEEQRKKQEEEDRQMEERRKKDAEEAQKRLAEEAKRQEEIKIAEAKIKEMEAIRKQEQAYEAILEKMVGDPKSVTEKELNALGEDVKNLKQEAENRISQLPREEREMKLALLRGDHLSEKTFSEVKETAIGLNGNLQAYVEEVNKIPVGNILAIQKPLGGNGEYQIPMVDSDSVDMADD